MEIRKIEGKLDGIRDKWKLRMDGGKGSGNWGHAGRPGKIGGSQENPEAAIHHRYLDKKTGGYTSFAKEKKKASTPHQSSVNELKKLPVGSRVIDGKDIYEKINDPSSSEQTKWVNVYTGEVIGSYTLNKEHLWGKDVKVAIPASAEADVKNQVNSEGSIIGTKKAKGESKPEEKKSEGKKTEEKKTEEPPEEEEVPWWDMPDESETYDNPETEPDDEAMPTEYWDPFEVPDDEFESGPSESSSTGSSVASGGDEELVLQNYEEYNEALDAKYDLSDSIFELTSKTPEQIINEVKTADIEAVMDKYGLGDKDKKEFAQWMSDYIELNDAMHEYNKKEYGTTYEKTPNPWKDYKLPETKESGSEGAGITISNSTDYSNALDKKYDLIDQVVGFCGMHPTELWESIEDDGGSVDETLFGLSASDKETIAGLMSDYMETVNAINAYDAKKYGDTSFKPEKNPWKDYKPSGSATAGFTPYIYGGSGESAKNSWMTSVEKIKSDEDYDKVYEDHSKLTKSLNEKHHVLPYELWDDVESYGKDPMEVIKELAHSEEEAKELANMMSAWVDIQNKVADWNMEKYSTAPAHKDDPWSSLDFSGQEFGETSSGAKGASAGGSTSIPKMTHSEVFGDGNYSPERVSSAKRNDETSSYQTLAPVCADVWNGLDDDERHWLYKYTTGSSFVNEPLTERKYYGSKSGTTEAINNLTNAIDQAEIPEDCIMVHGIGNGGFRALFNIGSSEDIVEAVKARIGQVGYEGAFMSCGADPDHNNYADGKPIQIELFVPKGAKGMYVEPFSEYGIDGNDNDAWDGDLDPYVDYAQGENEVILQRGGYLKLTGVKNEWGSIRVFCELVGQDPSAVTQEMWEKYVS